MTSDPWTGARLGQNSDSPLGGSFLAEAVQELSPSTVPSFASQSTRNTAFTNWKANGNTAVAGMSCFTRADGRFWRLSSDLATWKYAGGNPPPIVTANAGAGWSNVATHTPGACVDASGMVHLVGAVKPDTDYDPQDNGTHTACQLPAGYYPANTCYFPVPQPSNALVICRIDTGGLLSIVGGSTDYISANTNHYLDGIHFHPGYTGTLPFN